MNPRPFIFIGALLLAACPLRTPETPKDDSAEPADEGGETGAKSKPADEPAKAEEKEIAPESAA